MMEMPSLQEGEELEFGDFSQRSLAKTWPVLWELHVAIEYIVLAALCEGGLTTLEFAI
jgi:hypothetical protein